MFITLLLYDCCCQLSLSTLGGILPLELVCEDNLVRGELKRLFPTAIKKLANDNIVYSLQALLSEVK